MQHSHTFQHHTHQQHIIITHHTASFAVQTTATAFALPSAHTVIDATTESFEHAQLIRGANKDEWIYITANEVSRLTKGFQPHMPIGTDTMRYLHHDQLPPGRKATHARFVATEQPHKTETTHVRLTVGGNLINYPGKVSTPTSDISTINILLNSVISAHDARFAVFDCTNFYLGTPMTRKEYMCIAITSFPQAIIHQYHLLDLVHNFFFLVEISRGMYGLTQAGILAHEQLVKHLATHGYAPCSHTPGLWTHATRDIHFCLVVVDFDIKYTKRADTNHLLTALQEITEVTTNWSGTLFLGTTITRDYHRGTVYISLPGHVAKALKRFQHQSTGRAQHSHHAWTKLQYGRHPQLTPPPGNTEPLLPAELTRIQEIFCTLLFCGRVIDCTMLVALGTLTSSQSKGTQATAQAITQLLNYATAHPDAVIRFTTSDTYLHVHIDASYL
jgi:hypothetical protein